MPGILPVQVCIRHSCVYICMPAVYKFLCSKQFRSSRNEDVPLIFFSRLKDFDLANAKSCLPRRSLLWFKNRPWKPICHSQKDVVKGVFSAGKPAKPALWLKNVYHYRCCWRWRTLRQRRFQLPCFNSYPLVRERFLWFFPKPVACALCPLLRITYFPRHIPLDLI